MDHAKCMQLLHISEPSNLEVIQNYFDSNLGSWLQFRVILCLIHGGRRGGAQE
jgi:hypothetical protein